MFSMCSELTLRASIPDGRMEQIMQPWSLYETVVTHLSDQLSERSHVSTTATYCSDEA